jgi:quinol monooxygenase YgiN
MTNNTRKDIIYVVVDIWPKDDKVQDVKKILYDTIAEAKKERTCLKYELCENLNNKSQITLLQAWSTEQALDQHLTSEVINKATEELRPLLTQATEIRRYKNIG